MWTPKNAKRRFVLTALLMLLLCFALYGIGQLAESMAKVFIMEPKQLLRLYLMPLFWLFFSWIILQCLSVFGIVRPLRTRFNKILRLLVVGAVVLYAIFMLPYFVFLMKSFFLTLLSRQNHAAYQGAYKPLVPTLFVTVMRTIYQHPTLFSIPGVVFWFSKTEKRRQGISS